jgi:hypothetical protein
MSRRIVILPKRGKKKIKRNKKNLFTCSHVALHPAEKPQKKCASADLALPQNIAL